MTEDKIEQNSLEILAELGWAILNGPNIGPDGTNERQYSDVVLKSRLQTSLERINPEVSGGAAEAAIAKILRSTSPDQLIDNRQFHELLVNGVDVESRMPGSNELKTIKVKLFDFDNINNNDFVAVNQLTIIQDGVNRRPDVVLFVNGLPLVVIEIKNAADSKADVAKAFHQIQTYKHQISNLFRFNELCVISDGLDARVGTLTAPFERFMSWKTIDGEREAGNVPMFDVMIRGLFNKNHLLDVIRNFIVFERDGKDDQRYIKKVAAYHQYWAVNKAIDRTISASSVDGDHRAGVVWHTQGSGKSLSMLFYAGKLITDSRLKNPTVVVVTDRNDLDGQLFGTFAAGRELLRQEPQQAESRRNLRELLQREVGGVIFTTIQKFSPEDSEDNYPMLSDRTNIIVIADEAHRSQYGFKAHIQIDEEHNEAKTVYGNAKYMRDALPNASYIGFTGTPIETTDKSTPAVFGNYIDIYDVQRAVEDKATVPIYYESRLVDLGMDETTKQWLDSEVDDLLEGEEMNRQDQLKAEYAQKEAIVGNGARLKLIAKDIVDHFENRLSVLDGKGMIVTMSRRIAADLYDEIIAIRPQWHNVNDEQGVIKVVMTGSASGELKLQQHIRNKQNIKTIARRIKDIKDELKIVIVCDMWLTGFDVPSLHTMYLDKPLKSHNLMQAIARVNRVYPGKEGGLVVDYLGVAVALRDALATYTQSGGNGKPALDIREAIAIMKTKFEIVRDLFYGFDYMRYFNNDTGTQLQVILDAEEHILSVNDGKKRLKQHFTELSKAFALSMPSVEALELRDQIAFFQAVKARIDKLDSSGNNGGPTDEDYRMALKQIVDKAIAPIGVVDVFAAAGLEKPDLPVLSDQFLAEVRDMKRKNLAVEALQKLLNDEIKVHFGRNVIKSDTFSKMLADALAKYKNGTIEAAQVIEELIDIAHQMKKATEEGKVTGLEDDEVAFYDALRANGSATAVMQDSQLRELAQLLVKRVRSNISVDWTIRTNAQARLKVEVKRALNQYGYPPDQQALATDLVLEQAINYGDEWSDRSSKTGYAALDDMGVSVID
jgi:type I restriction enzyme R subunit